MSGYNLHHTETFSRKLRKIKQHDLVGFERVEKTLERLAAAPGETDGVLHGPHRGKLKKYVGRGGYRIVYNWCDSCRKSRRHLADKCSFCGEIPDNSVVLHDIYHKSDAEKAGY